MHTTGTHWDPRGRDLTVAALAFGPLGAFMVAAFLVPARHELSSSAIALALAIVIVLTDSVGGRVPGVLTSVTAALSFNFFHTEPYRTLHVHAVSDVATCALLVALGVVLGQRSHVQATARRHVPRFLD